MSDIDQVVRRAVAGVTAISNTAARFANRVLLIALVVCVGSFLLGVAALSGGILDVWIVLGIVFGAIAIGGTFIARWRVGSVRRHAPELADEVRTLVREGRPAGDTVIETFVVDPNSDGPAGGSAIVVSQQMSGFRGATGSGLESSPRLSAAVTAFTSFPVLVLVAIAITLVFAFLGMIFLIALAL